MASANVSRLQPYCVVIGVRKKPIVERGPNDRMAIRHPAMRTTGIERATGGGAVGAVLTARIIQFESDRGN